ncbi:Uma2 family endonuclease [Streptomyces sp. NPDC015346]|uniref:Uma2 family endonuclease n=1 Tax=Streptomyces sp. NPDC015346 TaxID=3364954 RepID=UPI0036F5149B
MTVDMDMLRATVEKLSGQLDGYKIEILEGSIVMSPVRPFHGDTIFELRVMLRDQIGPDWALVEDVKNDMDETISEPAPDLAVIPAVERAKNLSKYPHELTELAIEVVSPGSIRNDYVTKVEVYAKAAIPVYLIFDPYKATATFLWEPSAGAYAQKRTVPYGEVATLATPLGELVIDTGRLPIDPTAPAK